jgi:hypothetical protein
MSALERIADSTRTSRHVLKVPKPEVADTGHEKKSRPKAALNSIMLMMDHAAINAGFDFRR